MPLINKLQSYIVSHRIYVCIYILYMIVNVYCMPRVSFAFEIINVNLKIIFSRLRIYDFNGDLACLAWLGLGIEIGRSWQSNSQSMLWQPFSSMFSTPLSHIVNMARNRWCCAANGVLATSIHIIAMATFHVLSTSLRPAPFHTCCCMLACRIWLWHERTCGISFVPALHAI